MAIVDAYLTYQFVKRFVLPFKRWPAYDLHIIDEEGNVLKKRSELTPEERVAFGTFDLLVLNVKKWTASRTNVIMPSIITALLMKEDVTYQEIAERVEDVLEDGDSAAVPTNNVGSGAVAGAGVGPQGEPGKRKKKFNVTKIRDILGRKQ